MRYLLLSLFLVLGLLSCEDDEMPGQTGINVRIDNQTSEAFNNVQLRFSEQGPDADYFNYGPLAVGEVSEYRAFDQAGSCGIDLQSELEDGRGGPTFLSTCLCICTLEPGDYTLTMAYLVNNDTTRLTVGLE